MDQLDQNLTALKAAVAARKRRAESARTHIPQSAPLSNETVMPAQTASTGGPPRGWFARIFGG
ncbi:hypothetical protein [Sphingobium sp. LF-16]|uniref:hypothetical protein n=1 Tax=Sphingobium sp. LF-16 TaxID=2185111 RepID=UPI0013DE32D3|nr:hypothetical protein [Sphingobium sp. LF-16]